MDVRTGTASLGEYIRQRGDGSSGTAGDLGLWKCLRNGDSSYLSGGEERNWWFDGDIPGDDPDVTALYARNADSQEDVNNNEGIESKSKL
jgi:hypothetical protein